MLKRLKDNLYRVHLNSKDKFTVIFSRPIDISVPIVQAVSSVITSLLVWFKKSHKYWISSHVVNLWESMQEFCCFKSVSSQSNTYSTKIQHFSNPFTKNWCTANILKAGVSYWIFNTKEEVLNLVKEDPFNNTKQISREVDISNRIV